MDVPSTVKDVLDFLCCNTHSRLTTEAGQQMLRVLGVPEGHPTLKPLTYIANDGEWYPKGLAGLDRNAPVEGFAVFDLTRRAADYHDLPPARALGRGFAVREQVVKLRELFAQRGVEV